jgi:hypothetical protein
LFHPLDNLLIVADDKDGIKYVEGKKKRSKSLKIINQTRSNFFFDSQSVWNWEEGTNLHSYRNSNPAGTKISSLAMINPYDTSMVLVGSGNNTS